MIVLAALLLGSAADKGPEPFKAGAWEGRCSRTKDERCVQFEAVLAGPVKLQITRDASTISLAVQPKDCTARPLPLAINPAYSARTMTHMIRGHVLIAMNGCKSKLPIPELLPEDTAELLRQTEIAKD